MASTASSAVGSAAPSAMKATPACEVAASSVESAARSSKPARCEPTAAVDVTSRLANGIVRSGTPIVDVAAEVMMEVAAAVEGSAIRPPR